MKYTDELKIARKNRQLLKRVTALESIIAELKRMNERMTSALEHYADASSWPDYGAETDCSEPQVRDVYGLDRDGWTVAAEVLGYRFLDDGTEVAQ